MEYSENPSIPRARVTLELPSGDILGYAEAVEIPEHILSMPLDIKALKVMIDVSVLKGFRWSQPIIPPFAIVMSNGGLEMRIGPCKLLSSESTECHRHSQFFEIHEAKIGAIS